MFEDPKKSQNQSEDDMGIDYQGAKIDEGSLGGVASQDTGEAEKTENLGDLGSSDLNQEDKDKDMTE